MPRMPRQELAGAVHHVYARGNRQQVIYRDDLDRRRYLLLLAQVVVRQGWLCLAYCLMDNHVHLLIETPEPNLGAGMRRAHGLYAQSFNRRHRATGHLFQGRFGSVMQTNDAQLLVTARYIVRNPVASGLCDEPEDWPWSSHTAATSPWLHTDRLHQFFSPTGGSGSEAATRRRHFEQFVALR